jgi:hypothetical protein
VLFAAQRLGGGAVGQPQFLELVQLLDAFHDHDQATQAAGHPRRGGDAGNDRDEGGGHQLDDLEESIPALVERLRAS